MIATRVMIRYAPEINIKSPRVKSRFIRQLVSNVDIALGRHGISYTLAKQWSCLIITLPDQEGVAVLGRVFGVGNLRLVEAASEVSLEAMERTLADFYGPKVSGKTICVRIHREPTMTQFSSAVLEKHLGAILAASAAGVNLAKPDVKVEVFLGPVEILYTSKQIKGPGGLPLGSQGRALCLMSGGFDSPVAAWLMMKRGVAVDFCFYNLAGTEYQHSVIAVVRFLYSQWIYGPMPRFVCVDFTGLAEEIKANVKPRMAQVVLKRAFYKCADRIAGQLKGAVALVTGEAIGQVSSQTLHNLVAVDEAAVLPILRPLIAYDKEDIIRLTRAIGTFHLSAAVKETCGLTLKRPATKTRAAGVKFAEEDGIAPEIYESALKTMTFINLNESPDGPSPFSIAMIPEGATIIDTREADQYAAWHVPGALRVAFTELVSGSFTFELHKTYLLYCPFGIETALLCEKLQKNGIKAYSFRGGSRNIRKFCLEQSLDW